MTAFSYERTFYDVTHKTRFHTLEDDDEQTRHNVVVFVMVE